MHRAFTALSVLNKCLHSRTHHARACAPVGFRRWYTNAGAFFPRLWAIKCSFSVFLFSGHARYDSDVLRIIFTCLLHWYKRFSSFFCWPFIGGSSVAVILYSCVCGFISDVCFDIVCLIRPSVGGEGYYSWLCHLLGIVTDILTFWNDQQIHMLLKEILQTVIVKL